jgi:transposase
VLTLPPSVKIFLAVAPVDLRRGHDGLSAVVRGQWGQDLFAGHLFVFLGRRRDRCKILFWDRGGLVLYYKRLERGRFRMPRVTSDGQAIEMDATELAMLLDGIDVRYVRRPDHWKPRKTAASAQGIDKPIAV